MRPSPASVRGLHLLSYDCIAERETQPAAETGVDSSTSYREAKEMPVGASTGIKFSLVDVGGQLNEVSLRPHTLVP
jgi:hypothetical protein